MTVEVRDVHKRFGSFQALGGVSLGVEEGEILALLGPSGSGKTTLLRIIAGLDQPDAGAVLVDGTDVTGQDVRTRRVGFVFQHYALFRHMTVFENVAFGLRVARPRPSRRTIAERVSRLLSLVQLDGLEQRLPTQISGGQRQRVALARALAIEPRLLLLDEPFGALDAQVRKELRRWLRTLHDSLSVTSVFVTHDQDEALEVADRIVVINQGRVEQVGTPVEIYDTPASAFVIEFIGAVNRVPARLDCGDLLIGPLRFAEAAGGADDGPATAYVRPGGLDLAPAGDAAGLPATVRQISVIGPLVRVLLSSADAALEADLTREAFARRPLQVGDAVAAVPREVQVQLDGQLRRVAAAAPARPASAESHRPAGTPP